MCTGGGEWSGGGRALSCGDGCVCVQVESQVEESGLVVAGLYHAHDNLRDTHIDVFSQRIADKVLYWRLLISGACARDIKSAQYIWDLAWRCADESFLSFLLSLIFSDPYCFGILLAPRF